MRHVLIALLLFAFGAAKLPVEQRLTDEHRAAYFHGAKLDLDLLQRIRLNAFIAALSGFRAMVADVLWIEAHTAWERTEWGRMALIFDNVTALQPRNVMFWDMAAWHMAWNASVAAIEDRRQPRQALRVKAQREYFKLGEDFLKRGIQNNPDRYNLYFSLGNLYDAKFQDHCAAAAQFDLAARFAEAPEYIHRFAAYQWSYCPEHEREAYERLVRLYQMGEHERLPTLLKRLQFLQEKLHVPPGQRVYNPPGNS
jgi:hypothetical protein